MSNLATLLRPSRQRKIIHKGEQDSNMCFPWGSWLHFLKGSSQILVELTSLAKVLKEKIGWGKLSKENIFPRELVSGPKVPLGTWFALGNGWTWGNHVCLKNLSPCAPRNHLSFKNLSYIFKNHLLVPLAPSNHVSMGNFKGPFALSNHISFEELYNHYSWMIILPSYIRTIHDKDLHWKRIEPKPSHPLCHNFNLQKYQTQSYLIQSS